MTGEVGGRQVICDFCSEPLKYRAWDFPADDVDFGAPYTGPDASVPIEGAIGSWIACETCAALIADGRRGHLARRSLNQLRRRHPRFVQKHGEVETFTRLREVQDQFWAARRGAGTPISREQLDLIASDPAFVAEPRP